MWQRFAAIIPENTRQNITTYQVATDGPDGTLAEVFQEADDPTKWVLSLDITDAYATGDITNNNDFTATLIHEFAHTLTLGASQVPPDTAAFEANLAAGPGGENPEADQAAQEAYEAGFNACQDQGRFYTGEGCANKTSYINQFFQNFWKDIFDEHQETEEIQDDDAYYQAREDFYNTYQNQFVTDYAATNPGEDIAESFTAFILQDRATDATRAFQKINFFYNFEELVSLRKEIRGNLL